jgi:hypothetical protein
VTRVILLERRYDVGHRSKAKGSQSAEAGRSLTSEPPGFPVPIWALSLPSPSGLAR